MSNKKVLIVTYYWPPSGGSGVQRWLKFVKYLVKEGWEPVIYTPANPSFALQDPSLLRDIPENLTVLKKPIWEPYQFFNVLSRWVGKKKVKSTDMISVKKNTSLFQRLSTWVRGNIFIPDARVLWVSPSVSFLERYLKKHGIDKIITTGPPHSMHLIGLELKGQNSGLKWIADFRDPWSEWDLLNTLSLSKWARRRHQKLERLVLANSDRVITIGPYHVGRFSALGGRPVDGITNGFDEDDFTGIVHTRNDTFTIRHVGVVDELRDPRPVMEALKEIISQDPSVKENLKVEFIGNVNTQFKSDVRTDEILKSTVYFIDPIPHNQLLKLYGSTDLQLLVLAFTDIAPGNLPGKIFEYLASGNPILAIGPADGDAAQVLRETKSGQIFERGDKENIIRAIRQYYQQWKDGIKNEERNVELYSRRFLTQKLITLLETLE